MGLWSRPEVMDVGTSLKTGPAKKKWLGLIWVNT